MELSIGESVYFEGVECLVVERKYDRGRYLVTLLPIEKDEILTNTIVRDEEIFHI